MVNLFSSFVRRRIKRSTWKHIITSPAFCIICVSMRRVRSRAYHHTEEKNWLFEYSNREGDGWCVREEDCRALARGRGISVFYFSSFFFRRATGTRLERLYSLPGYPGSAFSLYLIRFFS